MMGKSIGAYRVIDKLGEGGMGLVYLAEHRELDRQAVVKVLHPHLTGNQQLAQRFINEAHAAARIHHPGIVDIMDAGYHDSGFYFILMEHLDGEALTDRLHREVRLEEATALSFTRQIARALGAAHAKKIVHRDLKPDNLFVIHDPEVAGSERIKILDFGIAKLMEDNASVTQSGTLIGSPPYMSPEQCLGAAEIDHRTDLYSLGVILFQMVAGRLPFERNTTGEYVVAHTMEEPPMLGSVFEDASDHVEAVVARLLSKSADERYQSTDELLRALGSSRFAPTVNAKLDGGASTSSGADALASTEVARAGQGATASAATELPGSESGNESRNESVAAADTVAAPDSKTDAQSGSSGRTVALVAGVAVVAVIGALAAAGFALFAGGSDKPAVDPSGSTATGGDNNAPPGTEPGAEKPPEKPPDVRANIAHTALADSAPMAFVGVAGGQFTMGSPGVEQGHHETEGPRHRVVLSPFQIGQYEVTQKQWNAVMDDNPSDCAFGCGDELPVQNVNWNDVIEFANRLSVKQGLSACYIRNDGAVAWQRDCDGYRLPTEAEWEYVARAGTHSRFSFGDEEPRVRHYAWYEDNGQKKVHPVGQLYPNPWGLYDVHGNVWEWVWDRKADYVSGKASDPSGPATGDMRMLRGGCYLSPANDLRSANRVGLEAEKSYEYLGFRLARGKLPGARP